MKQLYLVYPDVIGTVAPEIYGHFSEHIGGVFHGSCWSETSNLLTLAEVIPLLKKL